MLHYPKKPLEKKNTNFRTRASVDEDVVPGYLISGIGER